MGAAEPNDGGTTEAAEGWARDRLSDLGRAVVGEAEVVKDRSWSMVVRLPTDSGEAWLKINRGGTTYEPAVLDLLARVAPDQVLHPLAVEVDRGWSLNPDGGPTLRAGWGPSGPDRQVLAEVLRGYATLQRATAARTPELLAVGVPDLRPEVLPAVLDDLLDDAAFGLLAQGEDPDPTARERVMAHRELYGRRCAELSERSAAAGVPMTVQHDDLHDNNVFGGDGAYRVFDWGDCCVSHPFGTLLVALRSFAAATARELDDPEVTLLRRAYLGGWADLASPADLDAMADLAIAVAPVTRAHSWRNALSEAYPDEATEFADAVPGWLAELVPRPTMG